MITPVLALTAVVLRAMPEVSEQLVFERGGPSLLALGRLFTCHLVHWNWEHLLWDAAVFAVVGSWCERLDRKAFLVFLGLAAIAIPPIVLAARPELTSYAGLSGIDVGSVVFAVTYSMYRRRSWFVGLLGVAVVAKVIYELAAGRTVVFDTTADFVPVPLAHLVGACVGIVVAIATVAKTRSVRQDRTA